MTVFSSHALKEKVRAYWNGSACGTEQAMRQGFPKYSREYFDAIEAQRYRSEPEILSFAQFSSAPGQNVLEVGVGAGTDFIQWVRAGARAYGVDLTSEAVAHVRERLAIYGLQAQEVRVADCESLPYPDNTFDIVYSWGVIHHTPDTKEALREIVRVCRSGGVCRVMIYHRRSLLAYFFWIRFALLRGMPWRSVAKCLYHHMESIGTKAFTRREVRRMLAKLPIVETRIATHLTAYDRLEKYPRIIRLCARVLAFLLGGDRVGWFLTIEFRKSA